MSLLAALRGPTSGRSAPGRADRMAWLRAPAADAALTAAVATMSLALLTHGGLAASASQVHQLDLARAALALATALPLIAWRRWPLGVFVVVGVASIVLAARGDSVWPPIGLAAALYLFASRRGDTAAWTPTRMVLIAGMLATYLAFGTVGDLIHNMVAFAAAWFAGERTRLRRTQLAELRDRAHRAEYDAARERELAVVEERTRIARDLHDSSAHALNVIAIRAGAARLRHDPDRDLAALTAIEELARQATADIDHVVGGLRGPPTLDGAVEVPPGLAALDSLLAQHAASGHRVDWSRAGQPRPLVAPVDHGAYRILQEALTNAARYGTGTTLARLTYAADALHLEVDNTIKTQPERAPTSGGHGVIGMHERATSLGGQLTAGVTGTTYRVHAMLLYTGRSR